MTRTEILRQKYIKASILFSVVDATNLMSCHTSKFKRNAINDCIMISIDDGGTH